MLEWWMMFEGRVKDVRRVSVTGTPTFALKNVAVSLLFIFLEKIEKSRFFSKVFWLFGLIFWALELRDGSQIVDLVEIYRSKFLLFIFVPWASCLRSKYMIFWTYFLIFQCFSFFRVFYPTTHPIWLKIRILRVFLLRIPFSICIQVQKNVFPWSKNFHFSGKPQKAEKTEFLTFSISSFFITYNSVSTMYVS